MANIEFIRENPRKQEAMAARLIEALACHEDPVEAIQVFETKRLWIYLTTLGGLSLRDYLTPYEGLEIATGLNHIFGVMPSKIWMKPQVSIDVTVMGRGGDPGVSTHPATHLNKILGLANIDDGDTTRLKRPTAIVGSGLYWMDDGVSSSDDDGDNSIYITGIYAKMVARLLSEALCGRLANLRLSINVHNRELMAQDATSENRKDV